MRLQKYLTETRKIKSGDWVKGTGETLFCSKMVYGIFVSNVGDFDLVATWEYRGKIKKKIYVKLQDVQPSTKQSEAPKDLLKFAQKHSMYGLGLNEHKYVYEQLEQGEMIFEGY